MDLLIISIAAIAILSLITALFIVRARNARTRRIEFIKNRVRTREIPKAVAPVVREYSTPIAYDTSAAGLDVDEDLTEAQAHMIRLIFEEAHPHIVIKNNKEDFWATTERMGL
jgi:hypothetical protein